MKMNNKGFTLIETTLIVAMLFVIGMILITYVGVFDNRDNSTKALHSAGFTNIELHEHAYFACGRDDVSSIKFTATNPQGVAVNGTVCCGWLKGCTLRF